MQFYEQGRKKGDFEEGVRMALQSVLVSPRFLFRLEQMPSTVRTVKASDTYRINDVDLASRLSFFLWDAPPDAELVKAANAGLLRTSAGLDKQVKRMLADSRSEALSTRFAGQWLRLQDLEKIHPDYLLYPQYDDTLAQAMQRETELFFDSIVREDRPVLDLLTADYSFVNERLAKHYGFPNVTGSAFRRVEVPEYRHGLLGQGSILTLTSNADRTSPVQRGKWVMEVLLGSPPPPPPPNVPLLDDTSATSGGKMLTTRERMEEHRKDPACTSCHRVIDPLGLALENFDATGAWRIKDNEVPIDSVGVLYDGTKMDGPHGLQQALLKHSDVFLSSFTENLMTYALGRRVEYADMPTVRAITRDAAKNNNRLSSFVLGLVNSPAFPTARADSHTLTTDAAADAKRATPKRATDPQLTGRDPTVEEKRRMVMSNKHMSRRTILRGMGVAVALPLLDAMVPARTLFAQGAAATDRKLRFVALEMVHGSAGSTQIGIQRNLWAPKEVGSAFDLSPSALASLEPYRDALTIVSNADVRNAEAFTAPEIGGDHFRSSAVFLTQSHPKQTQGSDLRAGVSDQIFSPANTGRKPPFRRCSCASRTWIRQAAARMRLIRAPTPTRSAGRRRHSHCR